jgi:hypothetical protein
LAQTIPGASFLLLDGVSHFAPLQHPEPFNTAMLAFVDEVYRQQNEDRLLRRNNSDAGETELEPTATLIKEP